MKTSIKYSDEDDDNGDGHGEGAANESTQPRFKCCFYFETSMQLVSKRVSFGSQRNSRTSELTSHM